MPQIGRSFASLDGGMEDVASLRRLPQDIEKKVALGLVALVAPMPGSAATEADISSRSLRLAFDEPMEAWGNEGVPWLRLVPALPLDCRGDGDTDLICDFPEGNKARNATRYRVRGAMEAENISASNANVL